MTSQQSKGFKIRRPSSKKLTTEDAADREQVINLQDLRLADVDNPGKRDNKKCNSLANQESQTVQLQRTPYDGSEDNILCSRFPHMKFCGCENNCLFEAYDAYPVTKRLFVCNFVSGFKTRSLIESGITHILNITCKEYTKRTKFFKYSTIDIRNNTEEDIKKFFRMTNRYIQQSIDQGGTVLIHGGQLELAVCFALSYLIGVLRTPIKPSMDIIKRAVPNMEISSHFYKQLQNYDLEKLAFVTIKRQQ